MMDNLFATGRIFLIRKPIRGNYGPDRLFDLLASGTLGIDIVSNKEETYVIFSTKRRNMLLILHIDDYGYDLTKRIMYSKSRFRILFDEEYKPLTLTREELRRLVLYGSCEEDTETLKNEIFRLKSELQALQTSGRVQ